MVDTTIIEQCPLCEGNCDCYDVGISLTEDKYTEMLVSAQSQIKELERKLKIAGDALDKIETSSEEGSFLDFTATNALKQIRGE